MRTSLFAMLAGVSCLADDLGRQVTENYMTGWV